MLRRKILYLICLIAVLGLNVFYYEYQVFLLLSLIVAIPLASWVLYAVSSIGMSLSLFVERSTIYKNEKVRMRLGKRKAFNFCLARGSAKISYKYSEDDNVYEEIIGISEGIGHRAGEFCVNAIHNGYMYITVEWLDMYDYFKLFHTRKQFEGEIKVCIMPKLNEYHDELLSGASGRISEEIDIVSPGRSDEMLDLREFQDGDSVRDIHWKRSSTMPDDEYVVKQHLNNSDIIVNIIVDLGLYNDEKFRESLDCVYEEALSCGLSYAKRGSTTAFVVWNDRRDGLESFEFDSEESCVRALKRVMRMNCSDDALEKAFHALQDISSVFNMEPVIIANVNNN